MSEQALAGILRINQDSSPALCTRGLSNAAGVSVAGVCVAALSPPNESRDEKAERAKKQRRDRGKQIAKPRDYGVIIAIQQHLRNKCDKAKNSNGMNKRSV